MKALNMFLRTMFLIVLFLFLQFVCMIPAYIKGAVTGSVSGQSMGNSTMLDPMLSSLAMLVANVVMIAVIVVWKYYNPSLPKMRRVNVGGVITAMVAYASLLYVTDMLDSVIALPDIAEVAFKGMMSNWVGIVVVAVVGPLCEEMLFRGAIEGGMLREGVKPVNAILLSAFVFSLVHGNPAQMPAAFIFGVFFGWIFYRTGSIAIPMILHVVNNSFSIVLAFVYGYDGSSIGDALGLTMQWKIVICAVAIVVFITSIKAFRRFSQSEF